MQLVDARHVVIGGSSSDAYAVVDLPEVRFHWFRLPGDANRAAGTFLAVSPGLDRVVWLTTRAESEIEGTDEVHFTTNAGDHVVASLPRPLGGRCGGPDDSKQAAHTHSGAHVYVLHQPIPPRNGLMVFEGETAVVSELPPSGGWQDDAYPAMAIWSPTSETLFYRQHGDVWRWSPGTDPEPFLPGVIWYQPTITPDGRHLAYLAEGGMYLVDLAGDPNPRLIRSEGVQPVFLNSSQLWFLAPVPGGCAAFPDEPMVYNIEDSSVAPSVIDQVFGVWPATSSNH